MKIYVYTFNIYILCDCERMISTMNISIEPNVLANTNPLVDEYIKSLTEKEHQSYLIAKDHLGSLFQIEKTNGFLAWTKKQQKTP